MRANDVKLSKQCYTGATYEEAAKNVDYEYSTAGLDVNVPVITEYHTDPTIQKVKRRLGVQVSSVNGSKEASRSPTHCLSSPQ